MSTRQYFVTKSGQPPNSAVPPAPSPPNVRQHLVTKTGQPPYQAVPPGVSYLSHSSPSPPPTPMSYNPPAPAPITVTVRAPPPAVQAAPPAKVVRFSLSPPASPHPPAVPAPITRQYECPGMRLENSAAPYSHNGAAYVFPRDHTKIHFFHTGIRPFESPASAPLPFTALQVPSNTSLEELMIQLGVPLSSGTRYGVTKCLEMGGGGWAKVKTWTVGGAESRTTRVGELGGGGGESVVWLATYDREKHGAP